jgi:hypothetical protein
MKKLVIPFTVKVYLANDTYADTYKPPRWSPDYTKLYSSALGASITPPAFTEYGSCLKAGAHLHFILPDAFTHGIVDDSGYHFPAVPNRYAVTRLYEKNGKINVKCVFIESDCLQTKADLNGRDMEEYTVIPHLDGTKTPFRFLGRWYKAGEPPSPGEYLPQLTALGAGDPMFAAYYPTCRSVFGWYDDLADVPGECDLTYFVAGFFDKHENDPFFSVKNQVDFDAVLSASGFTADGGEFCNSCILFGEVVHIPWKGTKYHYSDMEPPAGNIDISFGATSPEAMSAVLAQKVLKNAVNTVKLEDQLTQLQYDLCKQSAQVDGNFKIDDEIHKRTFNALNPLEEYDELLLADKTKSADSESFALYRELRTLQREAGAVNRKLYFEKQKLYRAWETYIQRYEAHAADMNAALEETKALLGKLGDKGGLCETAEKIKAAAAAKRAEVLAHLPPGYELKTQTAESFWRPKEPVVMVSGDGILRSFIFGEDTKDGALYCQLSAQTSAEVPWETIKAICDALPSGVFPFDYQQMFYQAVLNSPALMKGFGSFTITGAIAPLAVNSSPLELSQLFMDWQTDYYYTDDTATLGRWILRYGETGYTFEGEQEGQRVSVNGRVPLTPHALYTLTAQLNACQEEFPGIYDKVRNLPFISQELGGFTDELTGLKQVYQLPVTYDTKELSKQVEKYIDNERLSVSGTALYPMRGGYLALSNLTLAGTFGQKQVVVENGIYNKAAAFFPSYMPVTKNHTKGMFPLTFSSAARLTAQFVAAENKDILSTAAPGSSPVCAVILPELINNRLLLYTGSGAYAGMLKTIYRSHKRTTLYLPPPDAPALHEVLRCFISGVTHNENALPELISLIQDTLDKTVQSCESDFIWGVPLVLTRLRTTMEFFGGAEYSKQKADFGKYDDKGACKLKIPLKFGNIRRVTDGCAGVYEDGDFSRFYALWGADEKRYAGYVTTQSPSVSAGDGDKYFTALLVPNSDLNIETGLLPVIQTRINAAHTALAQSIVPAAEINPVISNRENVRLPAEANAFAWRYKGTPGSDITADILPIEDGLSETAVMDGFLIKKTEG